jgi:hypothetical protein
MFFFYEKMNDLLFSHKHQRKWRWGRARQVRQRSAHIQVDGLEAAADGVTLVQPKQQPG